MNLFLKRCLYALLILDRRTDFWTLALRLFDFSKFVDLELGVDAVMSGRLVQRGDDLLISVDMIDVKNKKTLWGEQFERKMSDLLITPNAPLALLGHVYAKLGRRSDAEAVIKELEKRYTAKQADARDLALVYTGLDKDEAFAWLEKAYADHSVFLAFLRLEPLMEPLHSDPRWQDLEKRVGLSQ